MRKACDECGAVQRLEFVKVGAIDDARDDLANIVRLTGVFWDHAV